MDQIEKALKRLTPNERIQLVRLLELIGQGNLERLDVKKLVGTDHVYRVRKGDLRIIFMSDKNGVRIPCASAGFSSNQASKMCHIDGPSVI